MTFILIHGSWHNASTWEKVVPLLQDAGADVHAPSLTGMESKEYPGGPEVNLTTHIDDIVELITRENLSDVILVGHSYGGFVITGVADRLPDRVAAMVYLDAFIPEDGQSLFDITGPESEAGMRASLVDEDGRTLADGAERAWLIPPGDARNYLDADVDPALAEWLQERLVCKPVETFAEKLHIGDVNRVRAIPSFHIECTQFDYLAWVADKARGLDWPVHQIDSSHDAMLTQPAEVVRILLEIQESV